MCAMLYTHRHRERETDIGGRERETHTHTEIYIMRITYLRITYCATMTILYHDDVGRVNQHQGGCRHTV